MGFFQRLKGDAHLVLKDGRSSAREVGKRHFRSRKGSADARRGRGMRGGPGDRRVAWCGCKVTCMARGGDWEGGDRRAGLHVGFGAGAVVTDKRKQD